ncbi:hypothetical protein ACS0TY_014048 [Phlomoides rotata]
MESENDLMKPLKPQNMNWMSRMRDDFLQRLPEKLKSGLDSMALFNLDLSSVNGLLNFCLSLILSPWI